MGKTKFKIILLVIVCIIMSVFLGVLRSESAPLCIIGGMILYELKKLNYNLSNKEKEDESS